VEIMGHKFVVWNPKSEEWSVLLDECPHRLSPLSLGRIDPVTKRIECPLHGWQFDGNGTLQSIPQLDPTASLCSESRSVESYATHVRGDLLWVFLPTLFHGESFPESILPEDYYPDWINTTFYTQELPFSYDFLVEKYVWALCHCLWGPTVFVYLTLCLVRNIVSSMDCPTISTAKKQHQFLAKSMYPTLRILSPHNSFGKGARSGKWQLVLSRRFQVQTWLTQSLCLFILFSLLDGDMPINALSYSPTRSPSAMGIGRLLVTCLPSLYEKATPDSLLPTRL
jgi:nitrite reductase/ring-hydroxylating ferredoxin subunit